MPGPGRYLRTNYRRVVSNTYVATGWDVSGQEAPGFIFVSGTELIVFKTAATYLVLSGSASGSIADL